MSGPARPLGDSSALPVTGSPRPALQTAIRAATGVVAIVLLVILHESTHVLVGDLVGLPMYFAKLTQAGIRPVLDPAAGALAVMNGVAPIETMILGVVAAILLSRTRHPRGSRVAGFFAWWAVVGVFYIGIQLIFVNTLDTGGADLEAVAHYFHVSSPTRAMLALVGTVAYMASGFWVSTALAAADGHPTGRTRPLWRPALTASRSRRVVGLVLAVVLVVLVVIGTGLAAQGGRTAPVGNLFFLGGGVGIWTLLVVALTPWDAPGATAIRNRWIFPALAAGVVLAVVGTLDQDDLLLFGILLQPPIITAAWAQASETTATAQRHR